MAFERPKARPAVVVGLLPAVTTGGITAGTEATPTSFPATILVPSGAHGWTASGGTNVTAYNRAAGITAGGGKSCWLTFTNGTYYLVALDC